MPRKVKQKGWLYGTWISLIGERLEGELHADKFIKIIYGCLDKAGRDAIKAGIAEEDSKTEGES